MIVAGFGFRSSADLESLKSAFGLIAGSEFVDILAVLDDKADAECIVAMSQILGCPIKGIDAAAMSGVETHSSSDIVRAARDTGSVSEACALVAAGKYARLIKTRQISQDRMATCALATSAPTFGDLE